MKRARKALIVVFVVLAALAAGLLIVRGCRPVVTPTQPPTTVAPSMTPTATEAPPDTPTPTQTLEPTSTYTPTATARPTDTPKPTLTDTPEPPPLPTVGPKTCWLEHFEMWVTYPCTGGGGR